MRNYNAVFAALFFFISCDSKSKLDYTAINPENGISRDVIVKEICEDLKQPKTCDELKNQLNFLVLAAYKPNGKALIDLMYGKPFDKITYRDILIKIEED